MKKFICLFIYLFIIYCCGSTTLYLSPQGTDSTTCGQDQSAKCATITGALKSYQTNFASTSSNWNVTLLLENGVYSAATDVNINIWGYSLVIQTDPAFNQTGNATITNNNSIFQVKRIGVSSKPTSLLLQNIGFYKVSGAEGPILLYNALDDLTVTMIGSNITYCSTSIDGSGAFYLTSSDQYKLPSSIQITMTDGYFQNNQGREFPAIIYSEVPVNLTIESSVFSDNIATSHLYANATSLIDLEIQSTITMKNSLFETNRGSGFGVFYTYLNVDTFIENCTFVLNEGLLGGVGGILGGNILVVNSNFSDNFGTNYGGALAMDLNSGIFNKVNFQGNYISNFGGAIYTESGSYTFLDCSFFNNEALEGGHSIYCRYNSSYYFDPGNSFFKNAPLGDEQEYNGVDCSLFQYTQTCHFFGDAGAVTSIGNNYNCSNNPWVKDVITNSIYGVSKGVFSAIAIAFAFILICTYFIIRYIIRKQNLLLAQFERKSQMNQRLINEDNNNSEMIL